MKSSVWFAAIALVVMQASSEGRLNESLSEAKARYGNPVEIPSPHYRKYVFLTGPYRIVVAMEGDVVGCIAYMREDRKQLTTEEVAALLVKNCAGPWKIYGGLSWISTNGDFAKQMWRLPSFAQRAATFEYQPSESALMMVSRKVLEAARNGRGSRLLRTLRDANEVPENLITPPIHLEDEKESLDRL